jgi:oligopeptide/dipeptide ABC transporter ATP-binding protein
MTPLLELRSLVKEFPPRRRGSPSVRAVDGVDLELASGGSLGIVGESGSGKTTVGRCVLGLTAPTSGAIVYDGQALGAAARRVRREVQLVFQHPVAALDPRLTARQSVAEPLRTHRVATGAALRARVDELLGEVGIAAELGRRYPHELSGGQCQRVVIARALATGPRLLVLDEPTSALDVVVQAQILNLLSHLRTERGLSFMLISHDLSVVAHLADRIAVMYLGRVVEVGPTSAVLEAPLHPYTRALLRSRRGQGAASLAAPPPLHGETPPPWSIPSGCRFHTRCPLRLELGKPPACETLDPRLAGNGHAAACHFQEDRP